MPGDLGEGRLAVGRGEAQVAAPRHPEIGEPLARGGEHPGPVVMAERGLGEQGDGAVGVVERGDVVLGLDEVDGVGRDRHRADRLVVALVADVDDGVALAGPHLDLVVHLGDQRADGVDDEAAVGTRAAATTSGAEPWALSISGRALGHLGDVVDEHHAEVAEAVDDEPVVDDLVVAVHGRLEDADHPRQRLDRHLDACAEATRRGEQDPFDAHRRQPACPPVCLRSIPPEATGEHALSCPHVPSDRGRRRACIAGRPGGIAAGRRDPQHRRRPAPRDVIQWRLLVDEADRRLEVRRGGLDFDLDVPKAAGEPLGAEVESALFDQVRTCDNHCEFCFIYQLPPGLRPSLYLKDDDYRLSFLYGNFTTLTRFTELDLERVVTERLSPLNVSIHATDPDVRTRMLRNRRGATSLRWLRALLDHGIEVHGQVVVCPGVNDGPVLDDTLTGVLDEYPELASLCVVPLGVSRHSHEATMRPHTREEAVAVVDAVETRQDDVPARPRTAARVRRRRVLPAGRPAVPARRDLRGLPDARGRHRHGARLRGGTAR